MANCIERREKICQREKLRYGSVFHQAILDVKCQATAGRSQGSQFSTGGNLESQNSDSVKKPLDEKTKNVGEKTASSSKNCRILSDKPYRKSEKFSLNHTQYPDLQTHIPYKNSDKQNFNSRSHSGLYKSYEHDKRLNSRYPFSHNGNSSKNFDRQHSNSKEHSYQHEKPFKYREKHDFNSRRHSECIIRKESDSRVKNQIHKKIDNMQEKNSHSKSHAKIDNQDEESENLIEIEFNGIGNQRIFTESSDGLKISFKNEKVGSVPESTSSSILPAFTGGTNVSNDSYLNCNSALQLPSSEDDYIPPPVPQDVNKPDSSCTNSERNDHYQTGSLESQSVEDDDEAYSSLPDSEQLEAVSNYILGVVKERSVPKSTSVADRVVRDLNMLFKSHFEGNVIDVYGSYDCGLAITTSDINLVMIADISIRKSFMFEVYKILSNELEKYHVHPFDEGISAHQSKINFIHPDTGVNCQLAYLGKYKENIFKMGKYLKSVCRVDRVKTLIVATKIWAEYLGINEVEDGKLHPVGYALMVIHFLQHCENPLLPILSDDEEGYAGLPSNNASIGELWLSFLRYFSVTFNWQQDVITVNSKLCVSKKSKNWENYWIAVEDPFSGKNIAESIINSDIADHIKSCFKSSYEYFCNPPDIIPLTPGSEEDQSNGKSSCKLEFSFQQCLAEQNESFCENCEEIDDVCDECQKKIYVQPMASVPKMTDNFLKIIRKGLLAVYEEYILSDEEVNERRQFVKKLQDDVLKIYPDAELNLFGSSTNGFGFKNSDLDICLTFKTKKVRNTDAVLRDLRYLLRKNKDFDHVIAIFNATIPIIKFRYEPKGWRGDISLDNTLAVHNSELLYTYSLVDERCKILGCALKLLAKKALIAEVTEKALSSYSYLNMAIHFLQQTDPPVLPVLQDSKFREDKLDYKLDDIVEDCNVWFCRDIDYIKKVFKTENNAPVEQLWLDLLDYYCSYDNNKFITIRQKEILYISEKQRCARLFNIQDPFIVTKNLGCVVSAKKAQETKSVFNRARQQFRTPVKELPTGVKDIEDYFFSTMSLTGRIQKEVLCDLCGKFGHEQKDCKQSFFHLQRNNFYYRRLKQIQKAYRCGTFRKPMNRQPYRKQF